MGELPSTNTTSPGGDDVIDLTNPEFLLTVAEVAMLARLSNAAVYRAVRAGELHAIRLRGRVRVRVADFKLWLDESQVPPPDEPIGAGAAGRRESLKDPRGLRILLGDQGSD